MYYFVKDLSLRMPRGHCSILVFSLRQKTESWGKTASSR